jgi:toxin ParE1/3/4
MASYVVTQLAQADLEEIASYLQEESPRASRITRKRLKAAMGKLARFPKMGHVRETLAPDYVRFWPVYPYAIIYRTDLSPIHIVRVLHMARDFARILDESD